MWKELRNSFIVLCTISIITGIIYPLLVAMLAHLFFPKQATGRPIYRGDELVGSEWIGQQFSQPGYFWGRLSATSPMPYNAAASTGSNFGPEHPDLVKNARARLEQLRQYDNSIDRVPVDLVTSSASGLDPHISPAAAALQMKRVAEARKISAEVIYDLVRQHTEPRQFHLLGEPRVHVLKLNLALDRLSAQMIMESHNDTHATESGRTARQSR